MSVRPERPGSYNISLTAEAWRQVGTISASEFATLLDVLERISAAAARAPGDGQSSGREHVVAVQSLEASFEVDHARRTLLVRAIVKPGAHAAR
ncbi:MAG: hypothetical protein ACJ790_00640 [Myxococcaceae bacterium]